MSFILTEEQQMIRETAMTFVRDELPVSHLRQLRDEGANVGDALGRQKLGELGFFGILVPEEYGGVDLGMIAAGQIMEAQGRTIAATPMLQSAILSASLISLGGSEDMKAEWLPKIASGEVTAALAVDEGRHHAPLNIASEAERNGQGYTLNGAKHFVMDGHHADVFIIAARSFGEPGQSHGISLFLVPKDAAGLSAQSLTTVDSHGAAHLSFEGLAVPEAAVIGSVDAGWEILEPALDRGRVALAAEMLGSASAAFEMTLEYLQTRKQFGQLIGSFQSLQHRAAKIFCDLELTRSCIAAALASCDKGTNDVAELVSIAKARAGDLIHIVSNEAVQMHGGIGMTDDHDSGLYIKRARVQEAMLGGASYHRDRFARLNGY
ncbi:MAG: acyl-CoA dehydrogenase family protein [Henriciella sp.]